MKIIRSENGSAERVEDVQSITVPDAYCLIMEIKGKARREMMLELWHLAHDMRGALQSIDREYDIPGPIHTK